jgi:hypothetical protein
MLELLDLRARRERLEPRRLEIDPSVEQTAREIVARTEGDTAPPTYPPSAGPNVEPG